jgi:F0F1-type ATP synthase epsilon subunit
MDTPAVDQSAEKGGVLASDQAKANKSQMTMRVKVFSPSRTYFNEQAASISGENSTGAFDILPMHHSFITLLEPCELDIRRAGKQGSQRVKISGGLMHVNNNQVTVFLDV